MALLLKEFIKADFPYVYASSDAAQARIYIDNLHQFGVLGLRLHKRYHCIFNVFCRKWNGSSIRSGLSVQS
jgi:hypothetical protein